MKKKEILTIKKEMIYFFKLLILNADRNTLCHNKLSECKL